MSDAFFVTCRDGPKTAMILGPFTDEELCKKYAYGDESREITKACYDIDPKSHFFEFGMCRVPLFEMCPFNYKGILNRVNGEKWDKVLS
jgi:hypothetical protein